MHSLGFVQLGICWESDLPAGGVCQFLEQRREGAEHIPKSLVGSSVPLASALD